MDRFTLEIEMGNDAMATAQDVGLVLQGLGIRLEEYGDQPLTAISADGEIPDYNGNTVGKWRFE